MASTDVKVFPKEPDVDRIILDRIRSYAQQKPTLEILEAGCGRRWPFDLNGISYILTGIDLNEDALRIRQQTKQDLHTTIVGDLRKVSLKPQHYDIIYSAYVLEHVDGAEQVLNNFLTWLKPSGLLIVKFPARHSVYGFFTRVTPFCFHVLYKRHIVGNPNAGKPGFGPFPTLYDRILARRDFGAFIRRHGLIVRDECGYGTLPPLQRQGTRAFAALSFGQLTAEYYNMLYVLEAPPAS